MNIDGKDYKVKEFIFDNSRGAIEYGNMPLGIDLLNKSYLKFDNVGGSGDGYDNGWSRINVDASSHLDCKTVSGDSYNSISTDFSADFGGFFQDEARGLNTFRTNNNKALVTKQFKNLIPSGSCSSFVSPNTGPFATNDVITRIITGDGLYNNRCLEIVLPTKTSVYSGFGGSVNTKLYTVTSFAIKAPAASTLSPVNITLQFEGYTLHGVNLNDTNWHTYVGLRTSGFQTYCPISAPNAITSTTILISKVQLVEFDTYQQAADYLKSDFYALPSGDPISWHDSAIPTTGTYTKGDIIYNTNAGPGGYVGWYCVTAGTPGIWNPFGLISA